MAETVFERRRPAARFVEDSLAETRLACYWLEDAAENAPSFPALRDCLTADFAVVGGGYAGLWTAIRLREAFPDARVVLLEAKTVGWAASGRNGGFCEASLTHGEANGLARWPDEIGTLNRLGVTNLDEIERFVAEHGLDVEFERTGSLTVANEPHQLDWLSADARAGRTVLDAEASRARINSPTFLGAEFDARQTALVHPAKLAYALARHARDRGVEIYERSRVRELRGRATEPIQLDCGPHTVTAGRVALATNAFPSLLKRFRTHTVPVYDYVLMTEPLSAQQLASIGWDGREGLADLANQFHYSRLTADNRILWGGYDAVYHAGGRIRPAYEDRMATHRRLAEHFFTTFPQLAGLRFSHRWAGVIDTSTRFCAFFGEAMGGRVQLVTGFTGLGVGATHFAARVLVDRLAGRRTERTELEMVRTVPLPFPPEPLASAGIQATRWSLDRADHNRGERNLVLRTLDAVGLGFDS
ncbi:NAD(P)/FAD-dependent oxidoreductase [Leucobacter sp. M11]|uniref:NAD(P)/FAD-dependent oxidoreductase n=1 Tax=Leucobacter sp. M11 TaxID=2993565 RepID=UPI002D802DE8|nr:FAD-dependent oxidoreductase [Leucobacter sp. M11]MEB4614113.1 FAD-dependent oxidoreductase [Leucobacter sp. M11]